MKSMKSVGFKVLVSVILGLSLIGCGGGGGGSSGGDTTPTEATTNTGTFVDSPVEGLKYSTSTLSGFTDNQGRFQYKDGETVTFEIGNLELGSATGGLTITPLTLTGESDLNNISIKASNIGRLLQSLDNNSSNGANLVIPSSLSSLNVSDIDLESDADLHSVLSSAQGITSTSYILKSSTDANAEMKRQIQAHNTYPIISTNGKYKATDITKFYMIRLINDGKIHISAQGGGYSKATFYDLDMNQIGTVVNSDETRSFTKGAYIVKFAITYAGYIGLLSNLIEDYSNLTTLTNGVISGDKDVFYYKFTLSDTSNITFDASSSGGYTTASVYDYNLNQVVAPTSSSTESLNAGTYIAIIKIIYDGSMTISSTALN